MANETPLNHYQNCLPVQFCAIKLAKTPKLFKVNVHENIHWLNQQELMVAEIGLKGGGRPRQRILMMQSFRLKLKQPDFTTSYPSCPDDQEMVTVMFGPETILFLGSLSNFQCSERIRHVPPRGIWSYSAHHGLGGGEGSLEGAGWEQICAEGGFITVPKQHVVWSMSSLKFILFERGSNWGWQGLSVWVWWETLLLNIPWFVIIQLKTLHLFKHY